MQLPKSFICALVLASVAPVVAVPVQWDESAGGNGHWYDAILVADGVDWFSANGAALSRHGYLATVTSADENQLHL